jgi:Tfp pilus assembly PilM family ATPase/Tfp pilus assembly protein PilN
MAKWLALEWDAREARVAVARTRGAELVLEQAFAVELAPRDTTGATAGQAVLDSNLGPRLATALASHQVGRAETLIAVGRANIELRQLSLPPAPVEELPEMVRFQALRQFTTINEQWILDFVVVDVGTSETCEVLTAAISPEMVSQIRSTCEAADLTAKRLVLRPFAAASLMRRKRPLDEDACVLMVDLLADEADLTITLKNQVILTRTVRLAAGGDAAAQSRTLLGEVRRTVAAGRNQLRGRRIERVVLCGSGNEQALLKEAIETELSYPVETFDPFDGIRLSGSLQAAHPTNPGRFAPLIGMLLDEAAGAQHAIDFLHPRRKPERPNRFRRFGLLAGLAATVMLAVTFLVWNELAQLDTEIEEVSAELKALDEPVKRARVRMADVARIEEFVQGDYGWLDELQRLSQQLPPADNVVLTQILFSVRSPSGGQLILDGNAKTPDDLKHIQTALREADRVVLSKGGQEDPRQPVYRWQFKETVELPPRTGTNSPAARTDSDTKRASSPAGVSAEKTNAAGTGTDSSS